MTSALGSRLEAAMLSDEQIDEMENLIYFSEPDEVMEVLGKLIPVLFAELRITRGTLNSKVDSFLNGVSDARDSANEGANDAPKDGETAQDSREPVPQQPHDDQADHQSGEPQPELPASTSDSSTADKPAKKPRRVSKSGGHRGKKKRNSGSVDTRASKAKVDRNTVSKSKAASRGRGQSDIGVDDLPDLTGGSN